MSESTHLSNWGFNVKFAFKKEYISFGNHRFLKINVHSLEVFFSENTVSLKNTADRLIYVLSSDDTVFECT